MPRIILRVIKCLKYSVLVVNYTLSTSPGGIYTAGEDFTRCHTG